MAVTEVLIPQVNVNDQTAIVVEWYVEDGAGVSRGDPILSVETSKSLVDVESPVDGFVRILSSPDSEVKVGSTVAVVAPTSDELPADLPEMQTDEIQPQQSTFRATERARRLAVENHIDLSALNVTGIITERHVREEMESGVSRSQELQKPKVAGKVTPLSRVQRVAAQIVGQADHEHVSAHLMAEADWSASGEHLASLAEKEGAFVSPVDLLIYHSAQSLKQYPRCNATLTDGGIFEFADINIGATVDVQDDLYVVVIRNADRLSLLEIAARRQEYQMELFRGNADPQFLTEGTFTVTVLESRNLIGQIPIIFPEQAAILGTGGLQERMRVDEFGEIIKYPTIGLTLSYDHRFLNGVYASKFLQDLATRIESSHKD